MCNEYARLIALDKAIEAFSRTKLPAFEWLGGRIPNDLDGKSSVRIRDVAPRCCQSTGHLSLADAGMPNRTLR